MNLNEGAMRTGGAKPQTETPRPATAPGEQAARHVLYEVRFTSRHPAWVTSWAAVIEYAGLSGFTASCVQHRYDCAGVELDTIEIDPWHIEQDYRERGR